MPCTLWVGPESNKWAVDGETDLVIALDTWSTLTSLDTIALTCREACAKSVCQTSRKNSGRQEKSCLMEFVCMLMYVSNGDLHFYFRAFVLYVHGPWLVNRFIRAGQCFLMMRRAMSSIKGFSLFPVWQQCSKQCKSLQLATRQLCTSIVAPCTNRKPCIVTKLLSW